MLPDRYDGLKLFNNSLRSRECCSAVPGTDAEKKGRFTDSDKTDTMMDDHLAQRVVLRRGQGDFLQLVFRHWNKCFIVDAIDRPVVFQAAHYAVKIYDTSIVGRKTKVGSLKRFTADSDFATDHRFDWNLYQIPRAAVGPSFTLALRVRSKEPEFGSLVFAVLG